MISIVNKGPMWNTLKDVFSAARGNINPNVKKVIDEDEKYYPECSYNVTKERNCISNNGKMVCEVIESIYRECPYKSPVEIYSETVQDEGFQRSPPKEGDHRVDITINSDLFDQLFKRYRSDDQVRKNLPKIAEEKSKLVNENKEGPKKGPSGPVTEI